MTDERRDPSDARRPGATSPGPSLRNILRGLHHRRVHPDNILTAKCGPHGWGGKSEVYKATLVREPDKYNSWQQSKIQVAVKKLRFDDEVDQDRTSKAFVRELRVLDGLNHPNVAKLVGFVEDLERGIAWLVSSWEPNGNVRQFLMSAKCAIPGRISLIRDTLEGLLYLHTREPPICHGDLKSLNILVTASYNAVITDFGSARVIKRQSGNDIHPSLLSLQTTNDHTSAANNVPKLAPIIPESDLTLTNAEFSFRWAAPEVLLGDRPNLPSDIWAAAWTCWEILTDQLPFSNTNSEGVITMHIIEGKVPSSIQGEQIQMSQIQGLFRLMTDCWASNPRDRPSAEECLAEVRRLPSSIPSSPTRLGSKIRFTSLSCPPAQMRYSTSEFKRMKSIHRNALEVARSTENGVAAADTLFALGRAYQARGKYQLAEEAYIHAQVYYASGGNPRGRARAFEELGSVYRAQCLYGDAEGSYLRAKTIYTCLKDDLGRASTLCGLGDIYRARCRYKQAEEFYQEARGIHARSGEDRGRANALLGLGEVYSAQSRYRKAEETFLQARDMCSDLGDDLGRANALSGLGDVYRAQLKYDEAEDAYGAAYTFHTKAKDIPGIANALLGRGEVYLARTKYNEAEVMFTQAQAIYEYVGNDIDKVNALLGLGDVYRAQRKYDEAEKLFNQALNLSARTDNDLARANALRGLGDIHLAQTNYDQAEDSFSLARDLYDRIGNDGGSADALLGLGHAYRAQTKWDMAEESFAHAQYIYAHIRNDIGRANALSGIGDVYHALREYGDAERSYRQAYNLYAGLADDSGKANALLGLGEACVAQVKYDDAEMAFTRAQKIYTRIGNGPGRANVVRALELLRRDRSKSEGGGETPTAGSKHVRHPSKDEGMTSRRATRCRPRTAQVLRHPNRCCPFSQPDLTGSRGC
ncbi:hypothetical protein M407DRAFT_17464 [Tulasnella calospora MUT 4182]|uniref:Protein kinase domain-containing protein n=1 Tax=Tulasnella calospora MUT 4182 TaxID=1051891 RepID=A0A0C3LIR1_9AGAM|nr:hypothetical protein M407DRAFT_17464 [Tulasnella calospora MUT 4182]